MSSDKDKTKRIIKQTVIALTATYMVLNLVAKAKKRDSVYADEPDQQNPMEGKSVIFTEDESEPENADGKKGHLTATGESKSSTRHQSFYERCVKRTIDKTISFAGLVLLSPVMASIALAIKIEDPGPVIFTQKRVGMDKQYFKLHKFRSMKMSTPHDVPTHMLDHPEQYITKVGGFIRKHSLDELPQIWDIFLGNMSVVGPRPALWNQDVLVAERDKVGANDVKPGLTGWAQINGRDELSLSDKSALDGVYTRELEKGGLSAAKMDAKCFAGSIHVFGNDDTVVEGGTGTLEHSGEGALRPGVPSTDPEEHFACDYTFSVDHSSHKNVLIVGANSYIGESFVAYAKQHYSDNFTFTVVDTLSGDDGESELDALSSDDLAAFDIVYHLAGIAHADVGNVDDATKEKYYKVNTDMAVATAKRYKEALSTAGREGLFVFMSSMIVYGDSAPYGKEKIVDRNTTPTPANFYGDSKWQADKGIRSLADATMNVAIIRPPMIYGKGSKGNYPTLAKLAKKLPVFPDVSNSRSMLYVGNLCEFLSQMFLSKVDAAENNEESGTTKAIIFMPQNRTYTKTADMVKMIADTVGHHISVVRGLNPAVVLADKVPGKVSGLVDKAFGNNCYDQGLSHYNGLDYQKYTLKESIERTEGADAVENSSSCTGSISTTADEQPGLGKKVLIVASVASMIDQFNKPNIKLLESLGYDVDVATNFKDPGTITLDRCKELMHWLADHNVDCYQIDFDRNVADVKADKAAFDEMDRVFKGLSTPISTVTQFEDGSVRTEAGERHHTEDRYAFMHCHSPIGGVVGRIIAHKNHVKSIYTAHGFHFYDGAPLKNWLFFYPVEKELSRITDVLITINKEDYKRAKDKFYAKKTVYVPGVGVDVKKFQNVSASIDREKKREELGVKNSDILLLSVGELNENKNHSVVIKALGELEKSGKLEGNHIVYMIAGTGDKREELEALAKEESVNLRLLGFRRDVSELLTAADLYILPSIREGLNVSLMEAMASGTPCLAGKIRGNADLIDAGKGGELFDPQYVKSVADAITTEIDQRDNWSQQGQYSQNKIKKFDLSVVEEDYKNLIGGA